MKMFMEKVHAQWESITQEMQIFSKLDLLDHILQNDGNEQEYIDLIQSTTPSDLYKHTASDILLQDIQVMDQELQHVLKENEVIRNQISEKQNEIEKAYKTFCDTQKQWDEVFQIVSQLESDLKVPYAISRKIE